MIEATKFHILADELLQDILDKIEEISEFDTDYLSGTLEIECDDGKKYVINKHEPTRQIWFSSPFSGAAKFSYDENEQNWSNQRTNFPEILKKELAENYNLNF